MTFESSTSKRPSSNANESTSSRSPSDNSRSWHNAVAGAVAGACSRMATAPLDLIRIRRQLKTAAQYPSESLWQSWITIIQTEGGITALFRGNTAALALWMGYTAVQFSVYNQARAWIDSPSLTAQAFLSGAIAGVCATVTSYPFDVCRTAFAAQGVSMKMPFSSLVEPDYRVQSSPQAPRTWWEFATQLYRQRGIVGFYAGSFMAILQIIPYMGTSFAIYDSLTRDNRSVTASSYAGSISGACSKLLVYPLDTVKRRLQAQAFFVSTNQYRGMLDCVHRIAVEETWRGFYRGVVPSVLKSSISAGLSFGFFRFTKNTLEAISSQ